MLFFFFFAAGKVECILYLCYFAGEAEQEPLKSEPSTPDTTTEKGDKPSLENSLFVNSRFGIDMLDIVKGGHDRLSRTRPSFVRSSAEKKDKDSNLNALLVCTFCGVTFTTKTGLREHVNKHKGTYRYECQFCGKGFMIRTDYEGHVNAHLDYKPYECERCHKQFSYRRSLIRHRLICGLVLGSGSGSGS